MSRTLALLLSEKCLLLGQGHKNISPPQVQGCVSGTRSCMALSPSCTDGAHFLTSPGPSAGWKDHQGEEKRGFQQIAVLWAVGSGLAARAKLISAARRCWESNGEEGAAGTGHHAPAAGSPQSSPEGTMSPLGRLQAGPAVSLSTPHGHPGSHKGLSQLVVRADPPLWRAPACAEVQLP